MHASQGIPGGATAGLSEQLRQAIAAQRAEHNQAEAAAISRFSEAVSSAGISFEHHIEDDFGGAGAVPHLVSYARTSDLVILGKEGDNGRNIAHDVLFSSGVPVIVVPRMPQASVGRNVMIAWNGSREAARAVKDALPILERAANVTILCVNQAERGRNFQPGEELATHLRHHGIQPRVDNIIRNGQSVGDAIVSRMADAGADLLVMGAWGHSRLREFVLGGVTRSILGQTAVPVLMSH
jgi:nucleotide-binding universal stress UspA family protein